MKKIKINAFLSRLTDKSFDNKINEILKNMKGNANFENPTPSLEEIEAAFEAYTQASAEAAGGDRLKIAARNEMRKHLEELIEKLAGDVMSVAAGDKVKLTSSGFDLEKDYAATEVTPIKTVTVTNGTAAGEVTVKVGGARRAKAYVYEHTLDPATESSEWTEVIDTKTKHTITGLQSVKRYCFRVAVIGKGGKKIYSHVVTYTVQ